MARYRHPKHGFHVASYGEDLAALKAAGWVLDVPAPEAPAQDPKPVPQPPEPDPAPAVVAAPVMVSQPAPQPPRREWRSKRGR